MDQAREGDGGKRREPPGLVLVVRHGVTRANEEGIRLGHMPEPLSLKGRRQARELARRAAQLPFDVIWTSPIARARQTAEILARERSVPMRTCAGLAEMDYGPMEGLYEDEIAQRFPQEKRAWSGELDVAPPGAERLSAVVARVIDTVERIRATERALIVTHLTPMRILWAHYGGRSLPEAPSFFPAHCVIHRLSRRGLEPAAPTLDLEWR